MANGRAKTLGATEGVVKVIAHAETDRVLGVHIVGPRASDMIAEAVVAMEFSASAEDRSKRFEHLGVDCLDILGRRAVSVEQESKG